MRILRKFIPKTKHIKGLNPELSEQFKKYTELYANGPFNDETIEKCDQLMEGISNTKILALTYQLHQYES